jgi:hypothetical protein
VQRLPRLLIERVHVTDCSCILSHETLRVWTDSPLDHAVQSFGQMQAGHDRWIRLRCARNF